MEQDLITLGTSIRLASFTTIILAIFGTPPCLVARQKPVPTNRPLHSAFGLTAGSTANGYWFLSTACIFAATLFWRRMARLVWQQFGL